MVTSQGWLASVLTFGLSRRDQTGLPRGMGRGGGVRERNGLELQQETRRWKAKQTGKEMSEQFLMASQSSCLP